jgi:23S rRNA pseudouridine2457 synthase
VILAFHKPFGVLSQFTPDGSKHRTLAEFGFPKSVYPLGRLDAESEGLLLLSNEPDLNHRLLHPDLAHERTYWALVERIPTNDALATLRAGGIRFGTHHSLPCHASILAPQPEVAPREPPVRFRKNVPDCWLELILIEGKNHQVRRMTAAVGHPTLRLLRVAIGLLPLGTLQPGEFRLLNESDRSDIFAKRGLPRRD